MPIGHKVTKKECQTSAKIFRLLAPNLINKLKDTYSGALIARGNPISSGKCIGKAFVTRSGRELEKFELGGILVADRPGSVFFKDIDEDLAQKLIKQFKGDQVVFGDLEDEINEFKSEVEGKSHGGKHIEVADGLHAFKAVLRSAKAAVFSRGMHSGEISARTYGIPCISSCVGATENIATGQTIVVDADRGEVYDASLLRDLA